MVRGERVLEPNGLVRLAVRTQWDIVSHALGEAPRFGRTIQYTGGNKHLQVIDVADVAEFAKLLE